MPRDLYTLPRYLHVRSSMIKRQKTTGPHLQSISDCGAAQYGGVVCRSESSLIKIVTVKLNKTYGVLLQASFDAVEERNKLRRHRHYIRFRSTNQLLQKREQADSARFWECTR